MRKMDELISIIVPVYNAETTLARCVSALRNQTYNRIEIILVNDGSSDGSLALCQKFEAADARVRVVDKANGGVSSARNAGLDIARGEFIMFCDSDDWAEPDWCECLLGKYIPDSLVMCDYAETTLLSSKPLPCSPEKVDMVKRSDCIHYRKYGLGSPTTKIFCRNIIEQNHIRFPEDLFLGEDLIFVLKYLCAISGDILFLRKKLYNYYVVNTESLSKRSPSYEQCESFFQMLTTAMDTLNAQDCASVRIRDSIVLCDYEKAFIHTAQCSSMSLIAKLKRASETLHLESFQKCSQTGMVSNNKLLMMLYRKKCVKLLIIFYSFMAQKQIKRR